MPITGRGGAETPSPRPPRNAETRGIPPFLGVRTIGHGAETLGIPRVTAHLVQRVVQLASDCLAIGPNRPFFYSGRESAWAD